MTTGHDPADPELIGVTVTTVPLTGTTNGEYGVRIAFGDDITLALTARQATSYGRAALRAAVEAELMAGIAHQHLCLGQELKGEILPLLAAIGARLTPPSNGATAPLTFLPGLGRHPETGDVVAVVKVDAHGRHLTTSRAVETRDHAMHVLESAAASYVDHAYYRVLTEDVDLDKDVALATVADVADYLPGNPGTDEPEDTP